MQHRYTNLQGANSGLTAAGWEQVEALSDWVRTHEQIAALYCGPLLQSRLTAQRIGQAVGLPVSVLSDLPRVSTRATPPEQEPLAGASLFSSVGDRQTSRSDASDGQRANLVQAIDRAFSEHPSGTVALVTNADNIRAVIRYVLDANDVRIRIEHTSMSALRSVGDAWSLEYLNRRDHLPMRTLQPSAHRSAPVVEPDQEEDLSAVISVYDRVSGEGVARKAADDRLRISGLLDFIKLPAGLDVLDVGTGLGVLALMLAEEGAESVIGVDISPGMLEQAEFLRLSYPSETTGRVSFRFSRLQIFAF